jgi:hypothetical protein
MLVGSQHFGGRGACWSFGMGTKNNDKHQLFTWTCRNHGPDLGEATTFPLIVYSVPLHEAHIQMAFYPRTPKWGFRNSQSGTSAILGPHNFVCRPLIEIRFEASCIPHQELSNNMWHATCTQGSRVDSRLLMVRSQIANLTLSLSFGHNLCFKCPNGSCKPILDT